MKGGKKKCEGGHESSKVKKKVLLQLRKHPRKKKISFDLRHGERGVGTSTDSRTYRGGGKIRHDRISLGVVLGLP